MRSTAQPYLLTQSHSNKKDCQCIVCLSAVRLGSEATESQPRSHPRICRTCQENRDCVRCFFVSSRNPQQAAAKLSPHHLSLLHSERSKIAKNRSLCQVFSSVWVSRQREVVASCWLGKGLVAGGGGRKSCHLGPFLHFLRGPQGIRQTRPLHNPLLCVLEHRQERETLLRPPGDIPEPSAPGASAPSGG